MQQATGTYPGATRRVPPCSRVHATSLGASATYRLTSVAFAADCIQNQVIEIRHDKAPAWATRIVASPEDYGKMISTHYPESVTMERNAVTGTRRPKS